MMIGSSPLFLTSASRQDGQKREALTNNDVVELERLGFDEAVIVEKIRRGGHHFDISPEGIRRLEADGVSRVIIREMVDSVRGTVANSGEATASSGSAQPQASTGDANPAASRLSPAQIDARERATMRANRPVPVATGEARVPPPIDPPTEPALEPATSATISKPAASRDAAPRHPKKRKRRKPHRH